MTATTIIANEKTIQKTTCCYCGVGCGVDATVENKTVSDVTGDKSHPANYGRLCVKGSALHQTQNSADRLLSPIVNGEKTGWDEAINYAANTFRNIVDTHGPDSVAFYLSGQLLTEDYYVANKLMKGFIGSPNVDTNSRLCMAAATVAHKRAFGSDTVPGCYEDLESTDVLILVGSNTAFAHPVIYQRIAKAKADRPEMKVIVIDPRRTATCDIADLHLPLRAGADAFLFNGLLNYLAQHNALDKDHIKNNCNHFEAALTAAAAQAPNISQTASICDLPQADLKQLYEWFANTEKVVTVFSQGVNQSSSGGDKGNAIINCHLATGKIGKLGAAPFSITGQPNAMGGREVGGLANQLAAHMYYDNDEDIDRVARFWKTNNIARKEGRKAVDMFRDIDEGKIKAVWVMATNPAVTMPDANFVRDALKKCELVIVSDCIANTDTAKMANVLFPATTWGEKHGTVTNSERCISLQKGLIPPPGESKHDWDIISLFARALGFKNEFNYSHPVEIFREHAALSGFENNGSRDFDISAFREITFEHYESLSPIQWPISNQGGTARMFSDGRYFTPTAKANFIAVTAQFPKKPPKENQVIMNTGRIRDQWHTMSRTGNAASLMSNTDEPFLDVHPEDAKRFGIEEGKLAVLENLGARYFGRVQLNEGQRRGEIFVPMHWNDRFASSSRADALVNAITDPQCGQPEFKHSPVFIRPYTPRWQGVLHTVAELQPDTEYWCKILLKRGFKYRLADMHKQQNWSAWLQQHFPEIDDWVEMSDSDNQFYSACGFNQGSLAVVLRTHRASERVAESRWLDDKLGESVDTNERFALLAGRAGANCDEGKLICSCYQVGEMAITAAIKKGCSTAEALGENLQCGTNCGSCIPELNELIRKQKNLSKVVGSV